MQVQNTKRTQKKSISLKIAESLTLKPLKSSSGPSYTGLKLKFSTPATAMGFLWASTFRSTPAAHTKHIKASTSPRRTRVKPVKISRSAQFQSVALVRVSLLKLASLLSKQSNLCWFSRIALFNSAIMENSLPFGEGVLPMMRYAKCSSCGFVLYSKIILLCVSDVGSKLKMS